jgi:hypothetical protein
MTGELITREQMADLLTICSGFDNRPLAPETFEAWYRLLADLPYSDVADAVDVWYRTDRRRIMPADIVAHHERLQEARDVEEVRQHPPVCWGCGIVYALSGLEGSPYALPATGHEPGCKAMKGVLVFDDRAPGTWGIRPVNPAEFDEVTQVASERAMAEQGRRWRALHPDEDPPVWGAADPPTAEGLEMARRLLARSRELLGPDATDGDV